MLLEYNTAFSDTQFPYTGYDYHRYLGPHATISLNQYWYPTQIGSSSTCKFKIINPSSASTYSDSVNNTFIFAYDYNIIYDKKRTMRNIMKKRYCDIIVKNRDPLRHIAIDNNPREFRARETLRRIIGNLAFKKFIKDGFITIKAKSGLVYRVFPGHKMTMVYDRGVLIEKLCVVLKGDFPPTDSLIMRYLLILNDEDDFKKQAIKHNIVNIDKISKSIDDRSLFEIWRELAA